jgi:hypothetical protein
MDDHFECTVDAVARVAKTVMAPWGGAEACVNAYETAIRAATDHQLRVARVIDVEPVRSYLASCANMTRDIGATHLSRVRWILNV